MTSTQTTVHLPTFTVDLAFDDSEMTRKSAPPAGAPRRPVALVLHGGGGPFTVAALAAHLATTHRVLTPTLPGWNGTERPGALAHVADLASAYLVLLSDLDLKDVLVVGSSLGGWIASEMAARDEADLVGRVVVIDGAGVKVEGEDVVDFFRLTPKQIAEHSWHDADKFFIEPATLTPAQLATQRSNLQTMRALAGDPYMHDPGLLSRLDSVEIPVLVIWGESDRLFTPEYGRAYAAAFGRSRGAHARFELIREAGHLPHLERPAATLAAIDAFAS